MHFAALYHGSTTEVVHELENHAATIEHLQAALTNALLKIGALQRIAEEHSNALRNLSKQPAGQ